MMNYPVLTGAEAFYLQGGPIGILICHGFNATPQSVRDVGEAFAAKGFTVYAPRLRGHGTNVREFEQSTARCWKQSLQDGYARLQETCDQVFVIGQSMGATLALSLAADGIPFSGIITINAALSVMKHCRLKMVHSTYQKGHRISNGLLSKSSMTSFRVVVHSNSSA